ncbi:hypothetical protein, partial [Cronobacter sakazakii]
SKGSVTVVYNRDVKEEMLGEWACMEYDPLDQPLEYEEYNRELYDLYAVKNAYYDDNITALSPPNSLSIEIMDYNYRVGNTGL